MALAAIHYEAYYRNLGPWLCQGHPRTYNLGLNLDTSGASKRSGYDRGDTVYLPPDTLTQAEVENLFDCVVRRHATALHRDFERAQIGSSVFLGLMKTRAGTDRNGAARLVHADAPLTAVYSGGGPLILVERGGRVLVQTNHTANNAAETVVLGAAIGRPGAKPALRLRRQFTLQDKAYDGKDFLLATNTRGQRLQDACDTQWQ